MSRPQQPGPDVTPDDLPDTTPPRDLYKTADIRFVVFELGKLSEKLDGIKTEVDKQSKEVSDIAKIVSNVKAGVLVGGSILSIVGVVFWWALGDRITVAVQKGLLSDSAISTSAGDAKKKGRAP